MFIEYDAPGSVLTDKIFAYLILGTSSEMCTILCRALGHTNRRERGLFWKRHVCVLSRV